MLECPDMTGGDIGCIMGGLMYHNVGSTYCKELVMGASTYHILYKVYTSSYTIQKSTDKKGYILG